MAVYFTLSGYFFASLGVSPSPPNNAHAHEDERHFDKLVCKEIAIVNKDGEVVAGIATTEDGTAGIVIGNKDGEVVAGITLTENGGGGISLANKDGEVVVNIGATDDGGGGIEIFNKDGKHVAAIGTADDGSGILNIANEGGKVVARIETTDAGVGSIAFIGKDGESVAGITTTKDGDRWYFVGDGRMGRTSTPMNTTKESTMKFKLLSLVIALLIFSMPCITLTDTYFSLFPDIEQAIAEAKMDVQEPYGWLTGSFLASAGCGCLAGDVVAIASQVVLPAPPVNRLIGKTPAYVDAYTSTFKREVKKKRLIHTSAGCISGTALAIWVYNLYPDYIY